jgi:hypothetical protein
MHAPHPFRTRNDLNEAHRTRAKANENAANSTNATIILPLITVWLQVRVLPGPPVISGACGTVARFAFSSTNETTNASFFGAGRAAMGDTGKSFLMLELCRRVAFGESKFASPIFGGPVVREGTAVFLTAEDNEGTVHRRIDAIDPKEARLTAKGDRLLVLPLPSFGGAKAFWKHDKTGLQETDDYKRFAEALHKLRDVEIVCIDPLASFSHAPINEDPAAGQFVCSSLANLAPMVIPALRTTGFVRFCFAIEDRRLPNSTSDYPMQCSDVSQRVIHAQRSTFTILNLLASLYEPAFLH